MNELVEEKEEEFGQSYEHIKTILNRNNPDISKSEEIISENLDYYIKEYSEEMHKFQITTLYNIFNHKKRNLIDHNLAYSFIKQKNDPSIFILLPSLDSNKLKHENIEESFSLKNERFGFMPNNEFKYFENSFPINFIYAGPSPTLPGLLYLLKNKQRNKFDQLFIASQLSRDIYNLIDPNSDENYNTPNKNKNNFIQFDFQNEIPINGITLMSTNEFYPRSFDIFINKQKIKSITNAKELNGNYKQMRIDFDEKMAKSVRLLFNGKNWSHNTFAIGLKRVEFLSQNEEYSQGVFAKIVNECENKDPHRCGVYISAVEFDFNQKIDY